MKRKRVEQEREKERDAQVGKRKEGEKTENWVMKVYLHGFGMNGCQMKDRKWEDGGMPKKRWRDEPKSESNRWKEKKEQRSLNLRWKKPSESEDGGMGESWEEEGMTEEE